MEYYDVAAKWWSSKITKIIGIKNEDTEATELFEKKLAEEIKKHVSEKGNLTLECNYCPDIILGNIARETRVDVMALPWKTTMYITAEKVEVSHGFSSECVTIFQNCLEEN